MSPTHVDDTSLSLLYHKYLRYVDISDVLHHETPIDFDYNRICIFFIHQFQV